MLKISYFILSVFMFIYFSSNAQEVKVITFKDLEQMMQRDNDTTYIYNFWATWCKDCVEELPNYEDLNTKYKDQKVKVILVSMDFKRELDTRLRPFISSHKIKSQVVLLNAMDYNSWIDKVDPSWGGSLPATLFINKSLNARKFFEKQLTLPQLEDQIKSINNK